MNLSNKLTIIRIILVPLIILVWLFPYKYFGYTLNELTVGDYSINYLNLIILLIFLIGSLTDYLDGYYARKRKNVTTFGQFFDPIADKLMVNTVLIILVYKQYIPVLPVIIMICRDTIVDGCRMIASSRGKIIPAGFLGKLKTVVQMITIVIVLLNNLPFEIWGVPMDDILLWFSSLISFISGVQYYKKVKKYIFESI